MMFVTGMDDFRNARIINPGFGRPRFSKVEIRDIAIAVIVLSISFTIILARGNPRYFSTDSFTNALYWFLISLILVMTSFILHEMGHKFVAQRMGAWSEFRMYPLGLGLCLLLSAVGGILFAAPGAVYINGVLDKEMNGKISIAGPIVNIVLGFLFLVLSYVTTGRTGAIFFLMAHLNGFLAAFNMLPIPPLDGSKILGWNIPVYIITIAAAIALVVITW